MSDQDRDLEAFEKWWYNEGSAYQEDIMDEDDLETIVYKMTKIAWLNGAFKALEFARDKMREQRNEMFQTTKVERDGEVFEPDERDFKALETAFEVQMGMSTEDMVTKDDNSEWDMDAVYAPTHAAIWNKIDNIGKECVIIQKNNRIAFVEFKEEEANGSLIGKVYRLEDLSKLD